MNSFKFHSMQYNVVTNLLNRS